LKIKPNKNVRVGVLTFHNGPNFGGVLQAWHLVHAIRALGYTCHAVNYMHPVHHEINQARVPVRNMGTLRARLFWVLKKWGFRGFDSQICRHPFTSKPDEVPWNDFDVFVVGSDVVWEYQQASYGRDPVYFGELPGLRDKPILSYAASCGPANAEGPFPDYITKGLARFTALGVRDAATARLVSTACGRESTRVVDPTWLGPEPELRWSGLPRKRYLFVYGGRRIDREMGEMIQRYCQEKGLELVSALTPCRVADRMYRTLTPFQWTALFRHAEAVIALGTLHGTVYSIKYGKPFILITNPGTTQKIRSVLENIGQGHRLLEAGDFNAKSFELLDPELHPRPELPQDWKADSLRFLEESLAAASAKL
jgi:polysaccharide pyruvyl transferase WcaK-like protein